MARTKLAADLSDTDGSAAVASSPAGHALRAPAGKQSTSLTLRPLLAPFKGRGRLFLRIEKLPQRATLSAGKRNSDGSWSLASDELDDVTYQVPPQAAGDHVLTIRVTALDGGEATTLKVLDFPISFSKPVAVAPVANETGRDQHGVASQLGHMQSLFALREAEMGLLHAQLEQEQRERARDAGLIEQRLQSAFDQKFDQAAARHQQELEGQRAALQAQIADLAARVPEQGERERDAELLRQALQKDFDQRFAKSAAQHQQELEAQRTVLQSKIAELTARVPALGEKERDAEIIRQHLQKDFDQRITKAALQHRQEFEAERAVLQAQISELTARVPGQDEKERDAELIRQQLQKDFDQRFAQKFTEAAAQHQQGVEAERAALKAEITGLTLRADASERQLREEQQSREAYATQRAAQVEQELRATYDKQLEAAQAGQLALSQRQLDDIRRAAVAEGEENLRSARERWNADLARAIQQARGDWDNEQDGRIQKLQEQHEHLLAAEREKIAMLGAASAKAPSQGADADTAALEVLSDQLAAAGRALADRERSLEEAQVRLAEAQLVQAQLESERTANDGQAEKLLQQERGNWRVQENSLREQLSATQTQAEAQIASLTARCREAEARTNRNSWSTAIQDKARIDALNQEVASLRTALAKQTQGSTQDRSDSALKTAYNKSIGQEEQPATGRSKMSLLRDFCIAVCCITPLIVFYPKLTSFVHEFMSDDAPETLVAAPIKSASPQTEATARMTTVVRGVNMRRTASAKADVVFTLKKGAKVEILSTSGKWTEVGVKDPNGAAARGWVYSTYLQADGAP